MRAAGEAVVKAAAAEDRNGLTRTFTSTARMQLDPAVLRWFPAQADDQL
jgi:hypothetical protein